MDTQFKTVSLLGVLLLGTALLVAGCDSAGPDEEETENPADNPWSVANTLDGRITNYEGSSASGMAASSATQASNFEIKSRVAPPDVNGDSTPERASHLSVSPATGKLYVGYKIVGDSFGGGVDILDISGSFTDASDALQTDALDVQELAVRDNGEALFVGTALADAFGSTSQFHSLNLGADGTPAQTNPVEYDATGLPGTLVKSVAAGSNSGTYDAFAVSDVNSFHGIETAGNGWEIDNVTTEERGSSSGLQFRSVTETSSGTAYGLSDGGNLYEFSSGLPQITNSSLGALGSDRSIARLSAHAVDASGDGNADSEFLFVSLNENGFRVVDPSTGGVVFSDTDIYTTSVTATANLVYVATGDGLAVYEVGNGLSNTDPAEGLNDLFRASLSDFGIQGGSVPAPTDAQVNHVVHDGSYLYVAKSTDGVYKVEPQNPADYSAWSSVNTLGGRITNYEESGSSGPAAASTKQAQSFEIKSWVAAPDVNNDNEPERASHLSVSTATDKLYVGYKIVGDPYGGGVDILDISGSFTDGSDALQTDQLDVQELAVRDDDRALFVGTALDPNGFGASSQFHSLNLDADGTPAQTNPVEYDATGLPGTLVKSVVASPNSNTYDAFAVSDSNSFHGIETAGNGWEIGNVTIEERSTPPDLQFRSVTETSSGTAYALGKGGHLYEFSAGLPQVTSSSLGALDNGDTIARLSAHTTSEGEFLFVSLNENGFRVVDPSTGGVVFSDPDIYTTSVTATADFVYVATGDGLSVYEVESGLGNTDPAEGLDDLFRASLSDFDIQGGSVPTPTDAQVNHVVHDGSYLYVAKSTDGVYKVEQTSGSVFSTP